MNLKSLFLHLPAKKNSSRILASTIRTSCTKSDDEYQYAIRVFNTLTKSKEKLALRHKNLLYWYSCGPTVYSSAHIGHASSYVSFDIIKRVLTRYFRINVVDLLNITDIDDKIIKKAIQENKTFSDISKHYESEFFDDLRLLNCQRPSIILRVTDHIPEIVQFIQNLVDTKYAYSVDSGSVYFDSQRLTSVHAFFQQTEATTELDSKENKEKRNPSDFALWKAQKEDGEPSWPSPWGRGRPGWHIECSTLANIAFGPHLDFHSGGRDLVFPHHQNEILQCCAYLDVNKWASYWLHAGHLHLKENVKMSKSLSNTISIREMLQKYSSNEFRLYCLLSHYRNDKEFSEDKMIKPVNISNSFKSFIKLCHAYTNREISMKKVDINELELVSKLDKTANEVNRALSDDFNTSVAVDHLTELVAYVNRLFQASFTSNDVPADLNRNYGPIMSACNYVESILDVFGMKYDQEETAKSEGSSSLDVKGIVDSALKFRKSVRELALGEAKSSDVSPQLKKKIFAACDQFREDLKRVNIEFKDHKNETIWQVKK